MSRKMAIAEKWVTSNSPTKEAAAALPLYVNEDENPSISKQQEVAHHHWLNSNSPPTSEAAEDEALSLSDLPLAKHDKKHSTSNQEDDTNHHKDVEFNFKSLSNSALAESKMCNADEVFFQGQILPFRHSVSSDSGFTIFQPDSRALISRSMSMDHRYSVAHLSSGGSTRSSSIKSDGNSVTSGSSTSTIKTQLVKNHKPPVGRAPNQFHSHPSPSPQIRIQRGNSSTPHRRLKSTLWSFFRVSLIRTPEIKLADFKTRNKNNGTNFGSRNSTNSTSSTSANSVNEKRKKKQWNMLFDINEALFGGGGCKSCSVDQTVNPRINADVKNVTFANSSSSSSFGHVKLETFEKKGVEGSNKKNRILLQQEEKKGKRAMSRNRTFEWLKQLSSEGGPGD